MKKHWNSLHEISNPDTWKSLLSLKKRKEFVSFTATFLQKMWHCPNVYIYNMNIDIFYFQQGFLE